MVAALQTRLLKLEQRASLVDAPDILISFLGKAGAETLHKALIWGAGAGRHNPVDDACALEALNAQWLGQQAEKASAATV